MTKFTRRTSERYSKLGRKRKKKQVWRRPRGRDNKIRERRKGYPARVSIGYKKSKKGADKIKGKTPVIVNNIKNFEKIRKNYIAIIGHVGKKKKIDIVKRAKEKKIHVHNVNVDKFLKELKKTKEKQKENTEKNKEKKQSKK